MEEEREDSEEERGDSLERRTHTEQRDRFRDGRRDCRWEPERGRESERRDSLEYLLVSPLSQLEDHVASSDDDSVEESSERREKMNTWKRSPFSLSSLSLFPTWIVLVIVLLRIHSLLSVENASPERNEHTSSVHLQYPEGDGAYRRLTHSSGYGDEDELTNEGLIGHVVSIGLIGRVLVDEIDGGTHLKERRGIRREGEGEIPSRGRYPDTRR